MQRLSVTDAIGPAFKRANEIFLQPFHWATAWRLGATAYIGFSSDVPLPLLLLYPVFGLIAMVVTKNIVVALIILPFALLPLVIFAVGSRLQMASFGITLRGERLVAPAWRRDGIRVGRWISLKVAMGLAASIVLAIPLTGLVVAMLPLFRQAVKPNTAPSPAAAFSMFAAEMMVFAGFAVLFVVNLWLSDMLLPFVILEDATILQAAQSAATMWRAEPGPMTGFLLLRALFCTVGLVTAAIVFEFVLFMLIGIVGGICFGVGYALHTAGVPLMPLYICAGVIAAVAYVVTFFYLALIALGWVVTVMQAYTLYFLGGRYALLGQILEESARPASLSSDELMQDETPL